MDFNQECREASKKIFECVVIDGSTVPKLLRHVVPWAWW